MTVTYLTGTRYPSSALKRFLPEYLEILLQRGESLLTTNKPGVDALIVRHCDQHNLPLQVYEFACDSGDDFRNRRVKAKSKTVQVRRVVSPSWQRFRNLADRADKMIFFHAGKTRGRCYGMPTLTAFELACQKRGVEGEQLIVQLQQKALVRRSCTSLKRQLSHRASPIGSPAVCGSRSASKHATNSGSFFLPSGVPHRRDAGDRGRLLSSRLPARLDRAGSFSPSTR